MIPRGERREQQPSFAGANQRMCIYPIERERIRPFQRLAEL
jgi:hypothetical protein